MRVTGCLENAVNKIPCLYAIVRFAPFVETGEFANVGIVLMAPAQRYFGFKLLGKRYSRITHFFEQLDAQVFRATLKALRQELQRVAVLLDRQPLTDTAFAKNLFAEVVRPRETVIKYSEPRTVLADAPEATLAELYGFYVERNFVTYEYQETALERGVRQWLTQARLGQRFTRQEIGNADYHATFPFVEKHVEQPVKVIKPLHLAHDQPSKIIDHGGQWQVRVQKLRQRELLPDQVLFAVQGPVDDDSRRDAFAEAVADLERTGITVLPYENKAQILTFAAG